MDLQSQLDFERMVTLQDETSRLLYDVTTQLVDGNVNGVRKSLKLDHIEDDLFQRIYNHILQNPWAILLSVIVGIILLLVVIRIINACRRCRKISNLRHEDPKHDRLSKLNYWWSLSSHRTMDINLNKRVIKKMEERHEKLKSNASKLSAKLDTVIDLQKGATAPPPAYPKHMEHPLADLV